MRRWWRNLARQEADDDEPLASSRRALLVLLLVFEALLGLSYFVSYLLPSSGRHAASLIQLTQALAMLAWLWLRPRHYRWNIRVFLGVGVVAMASMAATLDSSRLSRLPSFLLILATFPFLATLMDGLRLGLIIALPVLTLTVVPMARGQLAAEQGLPLLLLELFFLMVSALMAQFFSGAVARLLAEKEGLERELKLRARLSRALFQELSAGSRELAEGLRHKPAYWTANLRQQVAQMGKVIQDIAPQAKAAAPLFDAKDPIAALRARLLGQLLWFALLSVPLVQGALWLTRGRLTPYFPYALGMILISFTVYRLAPAARSWVAWFLVLSQLGLVVLSSTKPEQPQAQVGLYFLPLIVIGAVLLEGATLGAMVLLGTAVALMNFGARLESMSDPNAINMGVFINTNIMVYLACGAFLLLRRRLIESLRRAGRDLAAGLARRQRLMAVIFHDVANPLAALAAVAEGGQSEAGHALAQRLVGRLDDLLRCSASLVDSDGPVAPERMRRVLARWLSREVEDLFQARLDSKNLTLKTEGDEDIALLALPEVLRDSVLANLISNAIKFSPPGSAIILGFAKKDPWIDITVRDQGPGMPLETAQRLAAGAELESTPGTQGEAGHGLGLMLARDYAIRMGGALEFEQPRQGGAVARLQLKAA